MAVISVLGFGGTPRASSDQPPAVPASVTVAAGATGPAVPRSYFGLSTEYWTLPLYAAHMPALERVIGLLHAPGTGPFVLRVGGDSADHAFWLPSARRLPAWTFDLTPRWTSLAAGLVRRLGLKLILDLNLITDTPAQAATWAQAAEARLPAGSIAGFEIGNEPDIYNRPFWNMMTAGNLLGAGRLPPAVTAATYVAAFHAYARALAAVAPHVPLLGPALAAPRSHAGWVRALLASRARGLRAISVHRYPLTACAHQRHSTVFPTISRVLNPTASAGMAASVSGVLADAQAAHLPVRLTELNSVTCGGRKGVSNTFATALWAPDALFSLMARGVSSVNLHVRANTINAPFAFGSHGLVARPLLYGLLMFVRALGPQARLVPVTVRTRAPSHLAAWAVHTGDSVRLLVIDKGPRRVQLSMHLPTRGAATVQRLQARSPRAETGVTLNAQHLDARGSWVGQPGHERIVRGQHGYQMALSAYSAALISVSAPS